MTYNLQELIKASNSGSGGSAGQTFRNDVAPKTAMDGTRMQDYVLPTGTAINTWDPPDTLTTYSSGSSVSGYVTFDYNSGKGTKFSYIRRDIAGWSNNVVGSVSLNSVTWDSPTAGSVSLSMTVSGDYDTNTMQSLSAFQYWFVGYNAPSTPSGSGAAEVILSPIVSGASSPSGNTIIYPSFTYDPDVAAFNPSATFTWSGIRVSKQAYPSWTTMYEWGAYIDSGYTTAALTSFYSSSDGNDPAFAYYTYGPVYIRYRIKAEYNGGTPGSWSYTSTSWTDPRAGQ